MIGKSKLYYLYSCKELNSLNKRELRKNRCPTKLFKSVYTKITNKLKEKFSKNIINIIRPNLEMSFY